MKTIGLLGGMTWHSTLEYYRLFNEIVNQKEGDENAKLIQDAMSYQIGKAIGEMATVLNGEVHGILITGGVANNKELITYVRNMVSFIAPVFVYPGEDEMSALAMNGFMVMKGEVECKVYE